MNKPMNMKQVIRKIASAVMALAAVLLLPGTAVAQSPAWLQDEPDGPVYMGGELLVKFKANATDAELLDAVRGGAMNQLIKHIQTDAMKATGNPGVSHMRTGLPVRQAIEALKNHPAVEFAEPNWVYTHQVVPDDPYFINGQLWGMYGDGSSPANQYGSQAAEAWAATTYIGTGSRDVVIGVIDEGIQITHPDLALNIWTNPNDAEDGSDNDSNRYVDDIHGWDFYENNNSVYDSTADDHATHVAGTIGAVGGNGAGVVGVNWNVTIISAKFLGPSGGSTADAVEAVDYFTALKNKGVNVVALNNSWGGGGYSQVLHDAIIRAAKANILFIAAAGNGDFRGRAINIDSSPFYPACYNTTLGTSTETAASYDAVISVTAIDSAGAKASWANYGATKVDLGAPGVNVLSTVPLDDPNNPYGLAYYSGTSMATPHVTGAAALYASTHTTDGKPPTALEIRNALLGSTLATTSLAGKTVTGGRLNLSSVIDPTYAPPPPPTTPAAPSGLSATAVSRSQINLTWADNADNETGFKIERSTNNILFTQIATVGANVTTYSNTGLARSTTYYYRVRAYNASGNSDPSNTASAKTPRN